MKESRVLRGVKFSLVALILIGSPGCLGRFAMTTAVREFNLEVTDDKWGREILFVALYIIPAYPISTLGDLLIVNSIEFWSEENPMSGEKAITLSSLVPEALPAAATNPLVASAAVTGPDEGSPQPAD
jgi:hypothetical protein